MNSGHPENEVFLKFWDHAEELRKTLVRIFWVLAFGFVCAFAVYKPLFQLLIQPLNKSAAGIKQIVQKERIFNSTSSVMLYTLPDNAAILPSPEIESTASGTYQIPPYHYLNYEVFKSEPNLLVISPLEGFLVAFKLSFWASLALTSPIWIYLLLLFILPALKQREKHMLVPFICSSIFCLLAGILMVYFVTLPLANHYLSDFNASIGNNAWTLSLYVEYVLLLFAGHIIALELCLTLLLLVHFRWLSVNWLKTKRRHMIVCAFVLGALLTPPDVPSQLMLALPLIGVYELTLLYGKLRSSRIYFTRT